MKLKKFMKNLLPVIKNLHPLLKEIADFYLYGSMGFDLAHVGGFLGDSKIADMRRAEIKGLKDGYSRVENMSDENRYKSLKEVKEAIMLSLNYLRREDKFYNFSIERIIDIVNQFDVESSSRVPCSSWNVAYIEDQEVLIPGKSHGI